MARAAAPTKNRIRGNQRLHPKPAATTDDRPVRPSRVVRPPWAHRTHPSIYNHLTMHILHTRPRQWAMQAWYVDSCMGALWLSCDLRRPLTSSRASFRRHATTRPARAPTNDLPPRSCVGRTATARRAMRRSLSRSLTRWPPAPPSRTFRGVRAMKVGLDLRARGVWGPQRIWIGRLPARPTLARCT